MDHKVIFNRCMVCPTEKMNNTNLLRNALPYRAFFYCSVDGTEISQEISKKPNMNCTRQRSIRNVAFEDVSWDWVEMKKHLHNGFEYLTVSVLNDEAGYAE